VVSPHVTETLSYVLGSPPMTAVVCSDLTFA
jgi:hypothetical protein